MELLIPSVSHKKNRCDGFIVIFDDCWIKNIFTQISKVINLGIILARQYIITKVVLVIRYNNQFTVVQRKIVCKIFGRDN